MESYDNPLVDRYASKEMNYNWSPFKKFSTWRKLWVQLAKHERDLGLSEQISEQDVQNLENNVEITEEDLIKAAEYEKKLRHDVMAHVHTYGDKVGAQTRKIIHLGATSCYVGDNTDLIQIKDGLILLQKKLLYCIQLLKQFCLQYKSQACLAFTHFQAAQLTTVGKRATLWLQDFVMDYYQIEKLIEELPFRGVKGTTGTQASFLELFNGDHDKVRELDRRITSSMGFKKAIAVTGQTYTRKVDSRVLHVLSEVAESAHKMATDIRLWMHLKEMDEPFEENQIGSSAMAYKRNPMRCERICSLSRFVMSLPSNTSHTHANQWFERTLDDSANRRLSIPQGFLALDGILKIVANVSNGLKIWPTVMLKHVQEELPFMATENILMACVKAGGDRQNLHELIRQHSMQAAKRVKHEGVANDLLDRIAADENFKAVHGDKLQDVLDPLKFVGRAPQQVEEFVSEEVDPLLERNKELLENIDVSLSV